MVQEKDILNLDLREGTLVEAKFSGFRGRIKSIDWNASKWPYTVVNSAGREELFAAKELITIKEPPINPGEVKDSLVFIDVEIRELEKKLASLKTTRSVLERVSNV